MGCGSSSQLEKLWINYTIDDDQKETKELINSRLKQNACFNEFEDLNIKDILQYMQIRKFQKSKFLFKKGQESDSLYFVLKGQCQVIQFDQRMALLSKGAITGELGMMHNVKRTFSVQCIQDDTEILRLTKIGYENIIKEYQHRKTSENFQTLLRSTLFSGIEPDYIRKVEMSMTETSCKDFKSGEIIIKKDDISTFVYIIKSGAVIEDTSDNPAYTDSIKLTKFRSFGEEAVLGKEYSTTIIALEPTTIIILDFDKIKHIITPVIEQFKENANSKTKVLKRLRSHKDVMNSSFRGNIEGNLPPVRRGSVNNTSTNNTPSSKTLNSYLSFTNGSASPPISSMAALNSYMSFSTESTSPPVPLPKTLNSYRSFSNGSMSPNIKDLQDPFNTIISSPSPTVTSETPPKVIKRKGSSSKKRTSAAT